MSIRNLDREWDEVVIIDLLSQGEPKSWPISGELRDQLASSGLYQLQMDCSRRRHVFEALDLCVMRAAEKSFFLHFTAHGNRDGIGNNDQIGLIPWQDIRPRLKVINDRFNGDLVIVLIACKGIYGFRLDDLQDPASPFLGIVGPTRDLSVSEASDCTREFYEQLLSDPEIPRILSNINSRKGGDFLRCISSQVLRGKTLGMKP